MSVQARSRGGSWLFEPAAAGSTFTPEKLTDEHRLIRQTAGEFLDNEVIPELERLEAKDWHFVRELVHKCGELGLLGTDVPEEFGGIALDKVSSLIVSEAVGHLASWAVTFGGQTGLSITPLLCFGTDEQKQKYLPRLVSGEMLGAYALSETGSGSDALGARCRAAKQADGSFVLNGEKMWITNGSFADYFTVFAKVDGEQFTAFLVERAFGGVSTGKEEHKMGLHGSSTTPLILQDVRVPAENVLGEVGKGHKVAFNVLNYGRFKLGAMCSGGARVVIGEAAKYASERRQFGRAIGEFGAIRYKLAEMCIRQYAVESMLYRIAGNLDEYLSAQDGLRQGYGGPRGLTHSAHEGLTHTEGGGLTHTEGGAGLYALPLLAALEEFAVEASIVKVAGSEMMDYVVDENVQIHGGNGFVRDYAAERHYRDARVNRIFEGTNEINRMIIPTMLARRFADRMAPVPGEERLNPANTTDAIRDVTAIVLCEAAAKHGKKLGEQQELLMYLADMLIDTFACDSVDVRAEASGDPLQRAAADVYINDAAGRVEIAARNALAALEIPETDLIAKVRAMMDIDPVNTVPLRNEIATAVLARRKYPFG